jgi:sialate O-acetylesterase
MKKLTVLLMPLLALAPALARAAVRLPAIISDHMVLPAGVDVPVWGWAEPGEAVTVAFAGQTVSARAAADGAWRAKLAPLKASSSAQTLTVRGATMLEVADVLVGEVWLGSGQSNMAMQMKGLHGQVDNADAEIAAAAHPRLRMFVHDEEHVYSIYKLDVPPDKPDTDRPGRWIVCAPGTAAGFSAIGYYFGREIQQALDVPFGFINTAVGGTPISAWTSLPAQQSEPGLKPSFAWNASQLKPGYDPAAAQKEADDAKRAWLLRRKEALDAGRPAPKAPPPFKNLAVMYKNGGLFNGMVAPVIPCAIRGVLWYQGERDALYQTAGYYGVQMETLIKDWRAQWGHDMWFLWVQLPETRALQKLPVEPKGWGVLLRERQAQALRLPSTGMAVTLGLGDEKNGHPRNKADFARRLALIALHDVYAQPVEYWMAPMYKSAAFTKNQVAVTFDHADGLRAAGGELKGFAIAGADKKFVWADARIEDGRVILSSSAVKNPVAVRYAWATNPLGNLANGGGLLAAPFRTDDWE